MVVEVFWSMVVKEVIFEDGGTCASAMMLLLSSFFARPLSVDALRQGFVFGVDDDGWCWTAKNSDVLLETLALALALLFVVLAMAVLTAPKALSLLLLLLLLLLLHCRRCFCRCRCRFRRCHGRRQCPRSVDGGVRTKDDDDG